MRFTFYTSLTLASIAALDSTATATSILAQTSTQVDADSEAGSYAGSMLTDYLAQVDNENCTDSECESDESFYESAKAKGRSALEKGKALGSSALKKGKALGSSALKGGKALGSYAVKGAKATGKGIAHVAKKVGGGIYDMGAEAFQDWTMNNIGEGIINGVGYAIDGLGNAFA